MVESAPGQPAKPERPRTRRRRWMRWAGGAAFVLILVLVAARLAMPHYLRQYVNRTLDQSPDYDGTVGDIDVHLWRGAYTIHDISIMKRNHAVPVPFFQSPRVDFSLQWGSLLHGAARGKVVMEKPKLNFVQGPSTDESQTGGNQPWLQIINELYPFRIDRAEVHGGEAHFNAFHTSPQVNVFLSDIEAVLENLTNIKGTTDPLIAKAHAEGRAMHSGDLTIDLSFDPQSHRPTFTLAATLLNLDVKRLNALTRAYGDFDFEEGEFDFVVEAAAKEGRLDGYAKPLFRGVTVLSVRDIGKKDPLQLFWEALVGIVGEVFKNQPRNQFGTRITLSGELDNPRTNLMEIIGNVLRNAFVRAYLPRLERGTAGARAEGAGTRE